MGEFKKCDPIILQCCILCTVQRCQQGKYTLSKIAAAASKLFFFLSFVACDGDDEI